MCFIATTSHQKTRLREELCRTLRVSGLTVDTLLFIPFQFWLCVAEEILPLLCICIYGRLKQTLVWLMKIRRDQCEVMFAILINVVAESPAQNSSSASKF